MATPGGGQVQDDEALARQLQAEENGQRYQPGMQAQPQGQVVYQPGVQGQVLQPGVGGGTVVGMGPGSGPVVQGMVVQGYPADSGQAPQPGQPQAGVPMAYGVATPGGLAYGMAAVVELPEEEVIALRYRFAMTCFASIDIASTMFNALSAILPSRDEDEKEEDSEHRNIFGFETVDVKWIGLIGLVFIIGPICGLFGARTLNRSLVGVYLVFCVLKMAFEVVIAFLTPYFLLILIALVQIWVTKVVFTFWSALAKITPERCKELLSPQVYQNAPVRMVYW